MNTIVYAMLGTYLASYAYALYYINILIYLVLPIYYLFDTFK